VADQLDSNLPSGLVVVKTPAHRRVLVAVVIALFAGISTPASAQSAAGSHDFDFNFGTWHTHIRRLLHPLSTSTAWVRYDGTVTVRKVWDGRANIEEIEADGPGHLEILNVRMYNPQSRQWSLNGADSNDGTLEPPMFGSFANGEGVFYDQEPYHGRMVLVRQRFFNITPISYRFEQAFSDDGGRTWQPNFLANLTRISATAPSEGSNSVENTSHDFDFNYATWATRIRSLNSPTKGAPAWISMNGTVAVRKIWNGRALMEEIKAGNAATSFQGLTLFLYDPQSRQWSQTYADSSDGTFERSMVGGFQNGRGELVSQTIDHGRALLMREVWSDIKPLTHHFEIQYSEDGGKSWHPTFVADLSRLGPGL
jgi:hypothetical protein